MSKGIILRYDVAPSEVCGGVFVVDEGRFVPVIPRPEYRDPQSGRFSLWEYADDRGNVRACMLAVPPGGASAAWEISQDTADPSYYELHQTVAGAGRLACWRPVCGGEPASHQEVHSLQAQQTIPIGPGDTFQISADQQTEGHKSQFGAYVLATFPGAAFDASYENQVKPPTPVLVQ